MNITLKRDRADLIQKKINSSQYDNAEEVIAEALQLLDRSDRLYEKWVQETRSKIDVAIEELKRGEGLDGDVAIAQLKEKLRQAREEQA